MIVTKDDEVFIESYFPGLKFKRSSDKLYLLGDLKFVVSFDKYSKKYKIFSKLPLKSPKGYLIKDSYKIEIELTAENVYRHVRETGEKIKVHPDRHKYPNGFLCIAGYLDEDYEISFKYFFCEIIIPFFYDQSCYDEYGFWPRPGFSHGFLGILENYRFKILKPTTDKYTLTVHCLEEMRGIVERGKRDSLLTAIRGRSELTKAQEDIKFLDSKFDYVLKLIKSKILFDNNLCIECKYWFKKCHKTAYKGLKLLSQKIRQYNIAIDE